MSQNDAEHIQELPFVDSQKRVTVDEYFDLTPHQEQISTRTVSRNKMIFPYVDSPCVKLDSRMKMDFRTWWAKDCILSLFTFGTPPMLLILAIILTIAVMNHANNYAWTKESTLDNLFVPVPVMKIYTGGLIPSPLQTVQHKMEFCGQSVL